jgi:hypothetical protein
MAYRGMTNPDADMGWIEDSQFAGIKERVCTESGDLRIRKSDYR